MNKSNISLAVDRWTCQAVSASRYLVRLYHSMADNRQATTAALAMGTCDQRAMRVNRQVQTDNYHDLFSAHGTPVEVEEELAWTLLVESQSGMWAFMGLIEDPDQARSLRGLRTSTAKALHHALKGLRVAFPDEMSSIAIRKAAMAAAETCTNAFAGDLDGYPQDQIQGLRSDIRASILEAWSSETGIPLS